MKGYKCGKCGKFYKGKSPKELGRIKGAFIALENIHLIPDDTCEECLKKHFRASGRED